jgi:hypothetical protein
MQAIDLIRILKAWFQTITADLITSTFTAAGIIPDREPRQGFYCCKVDLQRSIHMKNLKPDDIAVPSTPSETGQDGNESHVPHHIADEPSRSKSAPASPAKKTQKRIPIVKLDLLKDHPPDDSKTVHPAPSNSAIDPSSVVHPPMKQLSLVEMMKFKPKKESEITVPLEPKNQENMITPTPPQ